MKIKSVLLLAPLALLLTKCEKNYYYDSDPRFFNDAMHGDIVGKVVQTASHAVVIASQVDPVDSALINPSDGSFEIQNLPIGNYDLTIRAEYYRICKMANVMIQGAGKTYIGEVDLSTMPDLVSSHYPEDRDEIVYNNRFQRLTISVTFTRPMDRESVEKAFSTEPPTEGIFYWGQYSYAPNEIYYAEDKSLAGFVPGATITTFSKVTAFSYSVSQKDSYTDTSYSVKLSTAAMDTSGIHLRFPLEYSFSTVQSSSTLNGILTTPAHGDIDVALLSYNGIQITFPRNMDPVSTENAISMIPESDPIFIWPEYNKLTIYTGGAFHADAEYSIVIDSTAKDLDGVHLGHPFSFAFSTASVGLSSTYPSNGELFVSRNQNIRLTFNTYMVRSSVQQSMTISPAVSGNLHWYNDSKTTMEFSPSQSMQPNTKYTFTIGTDARDIFGSAMDKPHSFSFITRPD